MKKIRWSVAIWLVSLMICAAWIAHSRFTADMSAFLPKNPSAEQTLLVDQLTTGALSRTLLIGIEGDSVLLLDFLSTEFAGRLRESGKFTFIANGDSRDLERDQALLMQYRYLLSNAITPEHFTVDGLAHAIAQNIENMNSSFGLSIKGLLLRDPTGEMLAIIDQFSDTSRPENIGDVWISQDGKRALLIAQTSASGSDTDAQEATLKATRKAFEDSRQALQRNAVSQSANNTANNTDTVEKAGTARLLLSGTPVFSVSSRNTIRNEASKLSLMGAVAVVTLLLLVFRSLIKVLVCLIPVVSGAVAGIAAVSACFGVVHGMTLAFGTALIGEAVDYSIYYLMQPRLQSGESLWRSRFWPTIRLGVLTSICGFAALVFSSFPGLAQLGVYSIAGLCAAALTTRFVLPDLPLGNVGYTPTPAFGQRIARSSIWLRKLQLPIMLLSVIALVYLMLHKAPVWSQSLSGLSPMSAVELQQDELLRRDMGTPDMRYLVAVTGKDMESVLRGSEAVAQELNALQRQGVIAGFESPSRILPSQQLQQMRQSALPAASQLQASLPRALIGLPLQSSRLTGFVADVENSRHLPLLTPAAFVGSAMQASLAALLAQRPDGWVAFLPLRITKDPEVAKQQVRNALQPFSAGLTGSSGGGQGAKGGNGEIYFVDMLEASSHMYTGYFNEALLLALVGSLVILVLLTLVLKSWRTTLRIMLPLSIAIAWVMAGLVLLGHQLNLLHLVGILLIVAVGSNYALFFSQNSRDARLQSATSATLPPVLIANIATVLGFGVLAFSQVPALNAVGMTVAPGAILALFLSLVFTHEATGPTSWPAPEPASDAMR